MISKLLGHSNVAVTARYLDHLANGQAVSALETADLPPLQTRPASREGETDGLMATKR